MRPQSLFLSDIIKAADQVAEFIHELDYPAFLNHPMARSAVVWHLVVIGEAARSIGRDTRSRYPDVPWQSLSGMRNRLTHAYFGIDYEIVWKVASNELPGFRRRIHEILLQIEQG